MWAKYLLQLFWAVLLLSPLVSANNGTSERKRRQTTGGCNYSFQFQLVGQSAMLRSPGFPQNYSPNVACRYAITSPPGTKMNLQCTEFNVEASQNCQYDVFFMSPTGDSTFSDQQYFCGLGGFTRSSTSNRMTIGFNTDASNPESNNLYRFQCQISVVANSVPQPTCSCGVRNQQTQSRIVGGSNASPGEFPWRCALYSRFLGVFCGCSIISRNYILTAAHCTNGVQPGDQIYVNVGDHDLSSTTEAANQVIPVDYWIQNNLYNDQTQDSDISLLRLQTPLNFTKNISPICLPWKFTTENFDGKTVTASGWGSQFYGAGISPVLQKVDLTVVGTPRCASAYAGSTVTVTDNVICAYGSNRDTCQGDSGTSIDYQDPSTGRYYGVGVTSTGIGCGAENRPGLYTNVPRFLNWIQGNTPGETYCRI
ncbi:unnamed protein product [Orchesella dallaii]|uniref:Venom serine protease 34 n=1 Tax=Orchesella dallaii TaxID=48710 RepID=A0ABP1PL48_9HEXA